MRPGYTLGFRNPRTILVAVYYTHRGSREKGSRYIFSTLAFHYPQRNRILSSIQLESVTAFKISFFNLKFLLRGLAPKSDERTHQISFRMWKYLVVFIIMNESF